jgi:hypothetical protein
MDDAEIRGRLLRIFYDCRHNALGRVPVSDMQLSSYGIISADIICTACANLAEARLIEWEPVARAQQGVVVGVGRITGRGANVIDGLATPSIAVSLPPASADSAASAKDHPLHGINPLRISNWEKHGVDAVKAALVHNHGSTYVGGPPEVKEQAWRWVRYRKAFVQRAEPEVLSLKPSIWGVGIDLKAAARKMRKWWHSR